MAEVHGNRTHPPGVSPGATALKAAGRTSALAPPSRIILRRGFWGVQA